VNIALNRAPCRPSGCALSARSRAPSCRFTLAPFDRYEMAIALAPSLHCPSFTRSNDAREKTIILKGSANCDPDHRYSRSTFALAMTSKHPPRPSDGPGKHAEAGRSQPHRILLERLASAPGGDRRVELSGDTPIPWFRSKVMCAKCGARNNRIDVRPNWKEAPGSIEDWSGRAAMPGSE
jgi:hypothetical protein